MRATDRSTANGLEQTRRRIAHWRDTRTHRGAPMPAALWATAVALARRHGLYRTARTLRVDYGGLQKRLQAAEAVPPPAFVEFPAARPSGLGPCVIDVEGRRGRRLRIEVSGVTVADLVTLTQVAWGGGR
jgi:hypothetical protein